MAAHQKNQLHRFLFRALYKLNKCARIQRPSRRIQKHLPRRRVPFEKRKPARHNFTHFTSDIAAGPLQKFGSYRVGVLIAGFANKVHKQLNIGFSFL